ncbi:A/G-specific DNA-adenine glycosylase [Abditibacterium utsteinense]|uniref:Adenine DNA glycosylase n=1 Tax=Abditibacterium utsteinense TaxID=1960156 RepID=A0A2S8SWB7_9BACT|nr:A/G-specific adenine glycosylase [Abditibacterium utsteinense]PQV65077.1 A/G-specific DNA-adenine glycosylase [Abditibacterium utsteinense]
MIPIPFTPFKARDFAVSLATWFQASQRDMPWRRAENFQSPYRILVSEIMLQQTTVAAVSPFFERFVARFPDLPTLAVASEADVLAHWAGLGYYSRARNLHRAAKNVMELHGGEFPDDFLSILALPGVGRYTAGAVTSIALGQRKPIVDANVARVLSRVLWIEGDLKSTKNQAKLWEGATQIVEIEEVLPREINPALMELGALVCTPKKPRCEVCPVANWCAARAKGRPEEVPFRAPKAAPTPLFDVCALARNESGEVLLRRRPSDARWWQGMWELPRTTRLEGESDFQALLRLGDELNLNLEIGEEIAHLKHGVTRYEIALKCFEVRADPSVNEDVQWFSFEAARALALPSSMKTLLAKLEIPPARQLTLL